MANVIPEHMGIWTAAQTQKANGGRGRGNGSAKQSPYGIKKLRELILELAVRGKLVLQDPENEPASVLLEKIAKEKARLIKEGKIKKQKPLPEIAEDEKPFVLPVGWEFCRFGTLVNSILSGGTPSKRNPQYWNGNIPWASVKDLGKSKYLEETQDHITQKGLNAGSKLAEINDVIICTRMGLGKISIAKVKVAINQDLKAVKLTSLLDVDYFLNFFATLNIKGTGTTVAGIKQDELLNYVVFLPPLAEQHRIVAKVDELMALCDQLEQQQTDSNATHEILVGTLLATLTNAGDQRECAEAWQRIANHFDTLFTTEQSIDQLKQTILQLAVMGKLVPQDPNDDPASVLLEKIAKEKARLVKEGKIKKQKPLPEIGEDEKPFELAVGWEWTRLGNAIEFVNGFAFKSSDFSDTGVGIVKIGDIQNGEILADSMSRVDGSIVTGLDASLIVNKGEMLIAMSGATTGKLGFNTTNEAFYINQRVGKISPYFLEIRFLYYPLTTKIAENLAKSMGSAIPNLSTAQIKDIVFALPPLAEQHRIVGKVDELMTLCDTLKARLNDAQRIQFQLADVIVEQAVA